MHETIIKTKASNMVAGDIQQALRRNSSQLPSDYECDGLDLKFNWPGGLKKNQLRQCGDLASLYFVVNNIEQKILLFCSRLQ